MKRILIVFATLFFLGAVWYGESRKFYCLDNGECITVWKTYNNVCYIIPGRYYGILKPSENFIESTNTNFLTIYFTSEIPNGIVYKSEEPLRITNASKYKMIFYDYNSSIQKFDSILYKPHAKRNNDIKDDAWLMDLFIQENYVLDKTGKHL